MRLIRIIAIFVLVATSIIGTYLVVDNQNSCPENLINQCEYLAPANNNNAESTPFQQFHSDKLTFITAPNAPTEFVMTLEANRQQQGPNQFIHYYELNIFGDFGNARDYMQFQSNSPELQINGYLTEISRTMATDLSTRETFTGTVDSNNFPQTISFKSDNLDGDFITKNNLEYTRYTSVGNAQVSIGNQNLQTNMTIERGYSNNYNKYIFFPGFRELDSTTHKLAMFDEAGEYYLIDTTNVSDYNPAYTAHTWTLHKNKSDYTKKGFSANLNFSDLEDNYTWQIDFPEFAASANVKVAGESNKINWERGRVTGTITKEGETSSVHGYFIYKEE